jgi:DNA-binding transcriptional LysR family regulator
MDKLRALQYFVAAADERSFTGAARRLEVSIPAIAKLIAAFERTLGARLFERTPQGLTLTADGESYLDACRPLLEQLAAAEDAVTGAVARPRGVLVVGAMAQLAQHCILPALPRFRARYPEIQIDIRVVNRVADVDASAVDLFILMGWPANPDLVLRRIAQTRQVTCAAPAYWAAHGVPQHPRDLERHACLTYRNPEGTVVDLWKFVRGGEEESVAVGGWLTSNHRDVILDAVLAGEGVARISDLSSRPHFASGRLVPVLPDWEMKDAPPVNLLYRPNQRRSPRVRLFIEFITGVFRELEAGREQGVVARLAERPDWYGRRSGRASTAGRR